MSTVRLLTANPSPRWRSTGKVHAAIWSKSRLTRGVRTWVPLCTGVPLSTVEGDLEATRTPETTLPDEVTCKRCLRALGPYLARRMEAAR